MNFMELIKRFADRAHDPKLAQSIALNPTTGGDRFINHWSYWFGMCAI